MSIRAVEPTDQTTGPWWAPRMLLFAGCSILLVPASHFNSRPDVISHRLPSHHPCIDKQMSPAFDWHSLLLNAEVWFTNQFYLFISSRSCVSYVFVGGITCLISTAEGLSINIINSGCSFCSPSQMGALLSHILPIFPLPQDTCRKWAWSLQGSLCVLRKDLVQYFCERCLLCLKTSEGILTSDYFLCMYCL